MNAFGIFIFQLVVLLFSVIIHEISHGYMAKRLGDLTAELAGRLTLNPIKHIDPFGSIILPLILAIPALMGQPSFIIGWAKPVPYNPYNLKNPEKGGAMIAAAGPLSNIFVAAIFGIFIRVITLSKITLGGPLLIPLLSVIVSLNLLLAVFNLIPIPPLDGSKILSFFLPPVWRVQWIRFWQQLVLLLRRNWFFSIIILFFTINYVFDFIILIIAPIINLFHIIFAGFPSPFF